MAAAPAIVQFVGGSASQALGYTRRMYDITLAEHPTYKFPGLDFRGTPTGIDLLKVIETGTLPVVNTGVDHGGGPQASPSSGKAACETAAAVTFTRAPPGIRRTPLKEEDETHRPHDPHRHRNPCWPTYEPLQMKYFKRLAPNGANGQIFTHSNHVGTHLDGESTSTRRARTSRT